MYFNDDTVKEKIIKILIDYKEDISDITEKESLYSFITERTGLSSEDVRIECEDINLDLLRRQIYNVYEVGK